jgi:hypothetical protein
MSAREFIKKFYRIKEKKINIEPKEQGLVLALNPTRPTRPSLNF